MLTVVFSTSCYLHFISYPLSLTTFSMIGLYWWRLSSYILPCVCSSVSLGVGSVAALLAALPATLSAALAGALAGALAATLAAGLPDASLHFHLVPLQLPVQGDHCCGVVGEDVPICS
jgi:hypothetical protein